MPPKKEKNRTQVQFVKEKTPSLLTTLIKNSGRPLTEQELRQLHKMLKISVLVDGDAPTIISHEKLVIRGVDVLAAEVAERKELDEKVDLMYNEVTAAIAADPSTHKFDKSTPEAFKAACDAWPNSAKRNASTFKKVFGFTPTKMSGVAKEVWLSQIFLHFRA